MAIVKKKIELYKKRYDGRMLAVVIGVCLLSAVGVVVYDEMYPYQCVASAQVEKIVALKSTSATIQLVNGIKMSVDQETLEPGDVYCYKYERKKRE